MFYKNGDTARYSWNLQEGLPSGEPFSFEEIGEIKRVLNQIEVMYFYFKDVSIGKGYVWDLVYKI